MIRDPLQKDLVQVSHILATFRERSGRYFLIGRSLVNVAPNCEFMSRATITPLG
jgi:hypothetical protein